MGKSIVDAAAQASVRHFVFSTGPSSTDLTEGKVSAKAMNSRSSSISVRVYTCLPAQ